MLRDRTPDWLTGMPPEVAVLYRYWDEKRGQRRMPRRADLDPADLTPYLPSILLVDVVADERLYVYRLVGTREVTMRGNDPTGKPVMENTFLDRAQALRNYDQVVLSKAPLVDPTPTTSEDHEWLDMETIFLPLSEDDSEVDKILVYTVQKRLSRPIF
ncbi:PAS domain-containing protein [Dongia rigui]|uniref:PAS domain-containing protein n=1 Tax=Dongia rigui TaxID=940149 RepID=A0ABU5DZG1_9PROT|nr:PAS domain-containing protein [Dongia rigui]MDY0872315.1 PAS domain-containing protein [Dongia rigui]